MQKRLVITLVLLCIAMIMVAGCSSSSGDTAAVNKMSKMTNDMQPLMKSVADAARSEDITKMGKDATTLRAYIDANLPEMRVLAEKTTTKKALSQEYIAFLEDERKSADSLIKAVGLHNSGAGGYYTNMVVATDYMEKATAHMNACLALM